MQYIQKERSSSKNRLFKKKYESLAILVILLWSTIFFMQKARKIFSILSNKYLIAIVLFGVIILFTDHNNLFEQHDSKLELKELQAKKEYYLQEIDKTKKELADLSNNPAALEKYAREKFYMKRDNEDVFLVEYSTGDVKK